MQFRWFRTVLPLGAVVLASVNAKAVDEITLYTEHYPPFNIQEEDTVGGVNGLLLTTAFKELDIQANHLVVPWARAQANAREDQYSCFYSAMRSDEREPHYQWVGPLSEEHIVLFARGDNQVELDRIEDASEWRVGGQLNDAYVRWVENQGVEVETLGGAGSSIDKLLHDRLDLWVAGSIGGPFMAAERDVTLQPAFQTDATFQLWLACNNEFPASLIDQLDEVIEGLKQDSTRQQIMDKYIDP